MPLQSVEAMLDAATDAAVRIEWDLLNGAGLPSQADHKGATNSPHLTLCAAPGVPAPLEARLEAVVAPLVPVPVRLGPLVVLGGRRLVLARLVVPTSGLLRLHEAVAEVMRGAPDVPDITLPGRWSPHVTLARGLAAADVSSAIEALGRTRDLEGTVTQVRRWDPEARRVWVLGGEPTMDE
ncbi:MAG: 2'-5' RNA ligase family protein [Humibacillus sp.]